MNGDGILEAQAITTTCRSNRGSDDAWDEAVRRLREIYDAQVAHDPKVTLSLAVFRGDYQEQRDKRLAEAEAAAAHAIAVLERAVPEEEARADLWRTHWREQLAALAAATSPEAAS